MKRGKVSIFLSFLLLGSATNLLAHEENEAVRLNEIVTTGTFTEALSDEIPSAVEVITAEDIEKMNALDVKEILEKATNIQTRSQKGGINIRGFGANYSVVLVNGRKVSGLDAAKDSQSITLRSIDVNNIERIEILRGQAGAVYGSNAIGGVVNIITKKSQKESTTLSLNATNQKMRASTIFDTGKIGNFDMIVTASGTETYNDKADVFPTGEAKTKGSQETLSFDAGYQLAKNHEIRWLGSYMHEDARTTNRGITSRGTIKDTETPQDNRKLGTDIIYNGSNESSNWTTGITYSQTQRYIYENDNTPFSPSKIERFGYFSLDGRYSTSLNSWNTLTVGAEYVNETTNQDAAIFGDNLEHYSIFAQDEISLIDGSLHIAPLVRFDHYLDTFGSDITPSLGLTYLFNNNHRVKSSIGLGYKAPTITELYGRETRGTGGTGIISAGRGYYVFGNPDLQPEKSTNFDIRYEGSFNDQFFANLGYYFSDIKDKISTQKSGTNPISGRDDFIAVNIAEAQVQGVEAEFDLYFNENISMSFDYNYVDAIDKQTKQRLTSTAEHLFSTGVDFNYDKLYASLWGNYNVNYLEDQDTEYNFYTASASIGYKLNDKYKLAFSAYNFLSTNETEKNNSSIEPAEYIVTLTMRF